jgi:hypothetical protein
LLHISAREVVVRELVTEHGSSEVLGAQALGAIAQALEKVGLLLRASSDGGDLYVICPEGTYLTGRITLVLRKLQIQIEERSVIIEYWVPETVMQETVRRLAMLMPS